MNRRFFVKKLFSWGKMVFALCFFSTFSFLGRSRGEKISSTLENETMKITLREMARKKMHHNGDVFMNPFGSAGAKGPWNFLRWKLFSENRFRQFYDQERVTPIAIDWEPVKKHKDLSITFIKHSSVMISDQGYNMYIDPIFFNLSFLFTDFTPLKTDPKEMPKADLLLVTHGHYDHLDLDSLETFGKDATVITPLGYVDIFQELGMHKHRQLDWFETVRQGDREITLLPCKHWTMRNPIVGPNRSLWGAFLIKTATGPTIFISGDTAYYDGFREIGKEFDIDVAILSLGAYEPRWFMRDSHMNPAETVKAFQELRAKRLIITHWGTFRLGDEPVCFPPIQVQEELEKRGISEHFVNLQHGETFFVDESLS